MKLNPSIKYHTIIGISLGAWSFLFSILTRPFEHGEMDFSRWMEVSVGFSSIAFLSYVVVSWFQKIVFQKLTKWSIPLEVGFYLLFYSIYTLATYYYYRSPIITGFYDFQEFFIKIILNIVVIFTPLIVIARYYTLKLIPKEVEEITIKGENKLDILKIKKDELICISNSQNYVEIFFLENDVLRTKLIRSSLKKVQHEFDFLIQVHRSHLINPSHFKSWKDSATILLTQVELPVSKNYKNRLLSL